jgi:hypothetical protein
VILRSRCAVVPVVAGSSTCDLDDHRKARLIMIGNPPPRHNLRLMQFKPVLGGWSKYIRFWNRATIDTVIFLNSPDGKGLKISTSGASSPSTSDISSANPGSDEIESKPYSTPKTQRIRLSPWTRFCLFVLCVDTKTLTQAYNH